MDAASVTVLPPTIERGARAQPHLRNEEARSAVRAQFGLMPSVLGWLSLAGFPRTRGFDRVLAALACFSHAKAVCAGFEPEHKQIIALGRREDIPALMDAADLLVHPSRRDTTGNEPKGAVNGLPVITTAPCG